MGGYLYAEEASTEECPCCGGEASADYVDVGVGMVQCSPFRCWDCGAIEPKEPTQMPDGTWKLIWEQPEKPSENGQNVTGYLIKPNGYVIETTFDYDHQILCTQMDKSMSQLLFEGCVRITNLEGFAVDIPRFMTTATRKSLKKTLKAAQENWRMLPYVMKYGKNRGEEMPVSDVMNLVSRLPFDGKDIVADAPEEIKFKKGSAIEFSR